MHNQVKMFHGLALAIACLVFGPAGAWAQAASNVNCNKCVDTGDIAKKAVKKKNLAKNAVDGSRIADGQVKTIDLADGAAEESKLAAGAVTGGKIADGTVTGANLAASVVDGSMLADGAISSGTIADGTVTTDKLTPDAVFRRIIVVQADPTDTTGNCVALQDALAGITDNDADNRYLIHLEPGDYDCGTTQALMKPYVDIEGSGRGMTLIAGSVGAGDGQVVGAGNAELRHLSVENAGATDNGVAVFAFDVASFRITDVAAIARDTVRANAIILSRSSATLTNVAAEAAGATVLAIAIRLLGGANVEFDNVTSKSVGSSPGVIGLEVSAATLTARNSVFSGLDGAIFVDIGDTANLISTQLDGDKAPSSTGTFNCVDTYDGGFAPLDAICN